MSSLRFSVLLPTHNGAATLGPALASVLAQTVEDFEVLVVGDGCTDESAEVVASFRDPRVRWFELPKASGFGYANRNVVLAQARGELVAFAGHDDLWLRDHLELVGAPFDDPAVALALSMPMWVDPEGLMTPIPFDLAHDEELFTAYVERRRSVLPAGNVIHRRSCFEKAGTWKPENAGWGDWDLWLRIIAAHGGRSCVAYVDRPTQFHFRASWRRVPPREPTDVKAAHLARARFPALDRALRVDCTGNEVEQVPVWAAMSAGGEGWVRQLRGNVAALLGRQSLEFPDLFAEGGGDGGLALAAELNAGATLFGAGFKLRRPTHRVAFEGLRRVGPSWWAGPSAVIRVEYGGELPRMVLNLECDRAEAYGDFPVEVRVTGPGGFERLLRFERSFARHRVELDLDPVSELTLEASSALRDDGGRSVVVSSLYVGVPLPWNPGRWARRAFPWLFSRWRS